MRNNSLISSSYIGIAVYFLTRSLFIGFGTINLLDIAKNDAWICAIIGTIIGIIFILMITNLGMKKSNPLNNKFSFLPLIIIFLVAIFLGFFSISKIITFTSIKYLNTTPSLILGGVFLAIVLYGIYKGLETIFRSIEVMFIICISIFIIGFFLLIKYFDLNNLQPVLGNGILPVIKGSILYALYSVIPVYLIICIPKEKITSQKYYKKNILIGYLIGSITTALSLFIMIAVISYELASLYKFPFYFVLKKIELFGILSNIENFLSTQWIYDNFIFIGMSIIFIHQIFDRIISNKKVTFILTTIVSLIILFFDTQYTVSLNSTLNFTKNWWFIVFTLVLFIISYIYKFLAKEKTTDTSS